MVIEIGIGIVVGALFGAAVADGIRTRRDSYTTTRLMDVAYGESVLDACGDDRLQSMRGRMRQLRGDDCGNSIEARDARQ